MFVFSLLTSRKTPNALRTAPPQSRSSGTAAGFGMPWWVSLYRLPELSMSTCRPLHCRLAAYNLAIFCVFVILLLSKYFKEIFK